MAPPSAESASQPENLGSNTRHEFRRLKILCLILTVVGLLVTAHDPTAGSQLSLPGSATQEQAPANLLDQADQILRQMSEMTGLPIKAPLQKEIINREGVRKYLVENLHREMTPEELHAQEASLKAFGLVPRDFHLEEFLINFYTEQAAGFYDPIRKTMFIADWVPEGEQRLALAHELTHALQDQNFDLEKFLHAVKSDDDALNARQAVVEGYATAAMMQVLIRPMDLTSLPILEPLMSQMINQQFQEFPALSSAPFFFRFQALFPYIQGMSFMRRGLQLGGWKRLNQLFNNPPDTTKEIFAPKAYFEKEPLSAVSLPQPPALAKVRGLTLLHDNIMGELGYYSLLGQLISQDEAGRLGNDWLADRYLVYEDSNQNYTLVARTRWTSPEAASSFYNDYHTILSHKYFDLTADKQSAQDLFVGSTSAGRVILLHAGDECLWAEGVPAAQAKALLDWLQSLPPKTSSPN
jgi:hypothetical protein